MCDEDIMPRMPIESYAAKTTDKELLLDSTSGGVFTELARVVFAKGGVVCGAGWNSEFNVVHKCVETEKGLAELRGSKYVQSRLDGIYEQIRIYLDKGRMVLFTGMPCQCAALRMKFGENPNLIICGLICHSNTPQNIWRKYLHEVQKKKGSTIKNIKFRDKSDGWKKSRFRILFQNGVEISEPLSKNLYWRIFFSGFATAEACFSCKFRKGAHGADLIIGDFWGVEKVFLDLDYKNGISAILAYTEKGKDLLKLTALDMFPVAYEKILLGNPFLEKVISVDIKKRQIFQSSIRRMSLWRAYNFACYGPWYLMVLKVVYRTLRRHAGGFVRRSGLR